MRWIRRGSAPGGTITGPRGIRPILPSTELASCKVFLLNNKHTSGLRKDA